MNIEKEIEKALKEKNINKLKKIETKILKNKNLKLSIKLCKNFKDSNIKKHQKMIIDSNDLHSNYLFAKYVDGIDIKEHEKIVLGKNNPIYSYKFALNVKGADIKEHEKVVLDGKTPSLNYDFVKNIQGADIKAHSLAIIKSKDIPYNFFFARDVSGINTKEHEQVILESRSIIYNYDFAKYVEGADIKAHGDVILKADENYFNNTFLPTIPGSKEIYKEYIQMKIIEQERSNQTLAIIKPDGMKYIENIIEMFYKNDLKITNFKVVNLDEQILSEHYSHLTDKPYYSKLKEYMMSSPVAIIKLEGENALKKLRELMGPTDSTKAEKNTIRGMFGTDITYNVIHGSDSKDNAEIEIERFFKEKVKTK